MRSVINCKSYVALFALLRINVAPILKCSYSSTRSFNIIGFGICEVSRLVRGV